MMRGFLVPEGRNVYRSTNPQRFSKPRRSVIFQKGTFCSSGANATLSPESYKHSAALRSGKQTRNYPSTRTRRLFKSPAHQCCVSARYKFQSPVKRHSLFFCGVCFFCRPFHELRRSPDVDPSPEVLPPINRPVHGRRRLCKSAKPFLKSKS